VSVDTRLVGAVLLAALAVACTRDASSHDEASADEERTCQAGFTTPEGQQTESLRDRIRTTWGSGSGS
jgi:hypothetical protein